MIRYSFPLLIIIIFVLGQGLISYSQDQSNEENYYQWFDEAVGLENTGLFNGTRYKEIYQTKNGNHKFYITSEYTNGNIVYDHQPYYNIKMKYDIYEDQVIINIPTATVDNIFKLIPEKINQFSIHNLDFVNLGNSGDNISGFYEIIFKYSNFVLYKKNTKTRTKYIYDKSIFNKFKVKNYYLLLSNGKYSNIQSFKDLVKLFPEHKKKINSYNKIHKRLKKSNYDLFMEKLMNSLNNAIHQNSSSIQ